MIEYNMANIKKEIEISVLRVSSTGKYIEFVINCPIDYKFSKFTIQVYGKDQVYSIAESLFYNEQNEYITETDNIFSGQVDVKLLDVTEPSMYQIFLEAEHKSKEEHQENYIDQEASTCEQPPETIKATAIISDVSNVYNCLMDDILSLNAKCVDKTIQDRVIRNYLILYAHQQAMQLNLIDEAYRWFKIIRNCFSPCANNSCCSKEESVNTCPCEL